MPSVLVNTKGMTRTDWLSWRRKGIGSSDAPVIAGLSPWRSPVGLWLDKTGQVEPEEPGEAAYWGTVLEAVVAQEFGKRTSMVVQRRNAILQHPNHPWMLANLDRVIQDFNRPKQPGVLECKTTSEWMKGDWEGGQAPFAAQLQLQHQLAVTGYQWGALAVLIGGNKFHFAFYDRDEGIIVPLIEMEAKFWRLVETGTMPDPDGSPASGEALRRLYPEAEPGSQVVLPIEAEDWIRQYHEAKAAEDEAATRRQEAENKLKAAMAEAETGLVAGERRVTWKTVNSIRLDNKRIKSERPDIYQQYGQESVSRRFVVKGDR